MSTDDWLIDQHLCRCCHSEGKFKSLTEPMTENEMLYYDALQICMNITLSPVEGPLATAACCICDMCMMRLQEVSSFRRQVLRCEESFLSLYTQDRIKLSSLESTIVKEELQDRADADLKDNDGDGMDFPIGEVSDTETNDNYRNTYFKDNGGDTETLIGEVPKIIKKKKSKTRATKKKSRPPRLHTPVEDLYEDNETQYYEQTGDIFKCKRCSKTYTSYNGLRFHVKSQHLNEAKYKCTLCNSSFRTLAPFTKHKLDIHNVDDRLKCNACDNIFNTRTQLIKHKNSFHMLGVKQKCSQCDYESFSVESLYKHKFKHRTVKEFHCKFCRKSFLRKATLDLHERIHTGDRRKVCAECGQAFVQKASLNYHMAKYHPEVNF